MWTAMDHKIGMDSPCNERNDNSPAAFFFVLWVYVGNFALFNLFAATVVNMFARVKEQQELLDMEDGDTAMLSKEQRQW